MSHHGNESGFPEGLAQDFLNDSLEEEFKKMRRMEEKYPEGKLRADDEGSTLFAVGTQDGKVVIQFVEPMKWLGMNPTQAMELAQLLIKHARSIKHKSILTRLERLECSSS